MSAWTYDSTIGQHMYAWEGYTAYISWEDDTATYMGSVWLGSEPVTCKEFASMTNAAIWCGDVMWGDYILSEQMHNELTGNFSQESE